MANPRHLLGLHAEAVVADWLTVLGWRVLARRWRCSDGELDLVCLDPERRLVGIEVRARRRAIHGSALESLDRRRLQRRRRALVRYAAEHRLGALDLRVDLVSVEPSGERWRLVRHPLVDP